MARQAALLNMGGLAASEPGLVVPASLKPPVGLELGATRPVPQIGFDRVPGRLAVPGDVIFRDPVRDTLIAQHAHEPVEQDGGVSVADCGANASCLERCASVVYQCW
jgi:hypothetical protein